MSSKNPKKSSILFKRCIYCAFFVFLFLILSICLYYYNGVYKINFHKNLKKLEEKKLTVKDELNDIDNKIKIAERFKAMWDSEIEKQSKNYKGGDIKYVNDIVSRLERVNLLMNTKIEEFETSIYRRNQYDSNITTIVKEIKVSFNCISEHAVYNFIDGFKNMFNGFVILKEVEINSLKEIDKTFVKNMANGNLDYLMVASVTMYLYYVEI